MSDLITAFLLKRHSDGAWLVFGEFDLSPVALPRIGEALIRDGKKWRVVDLAWQFTNPDDPLEYCVDLRVEPETTSPGEAG